MADLLRRIFVENLVIKALALALAVTLVLVKREDQDTDITATARVRVTHPDSRVLVSPPVDKVRITVRGKYNRLRTFDADNVAAVDLNLSGFEEGQVTFDPELFKLPAGLQISSVRPAAMLVRFEPRVQRSVPVEVRLNGEPAPGYRVTQASVDPPTVMVEGAESVVKALDKVVTEPVSVADRNKTTRLSVQLEPPVAYAEYREASKRFTVTFVIEEKRGTRLVEGVLVEVRDLPVDEPGFEVSPQGVAITVTGPAGRLDTLDTEAVIAYVSASGLGPGNLHARSVQVEVPEGLQVADIEPTQVTLVRLPPPPPPSPPDAGPADAGVDAGVQP